MIGIDIIEVERIKKAQAKNEKFKNLICTDNELNYLKNFKVDFYSHMAGFFCVKEAVMKALGDCKKISFLDIEVIHEKNGKPNIKLGGQAKVAFDKFKSAKIEVSISQTKNYATAICMIL